MQRILIVCAENICRSPLAEHLIRARLRDLPGFESVMVASGGTRAGAGNRICGRVLASGAGESWASGLTAHRSRPITVTDLDESALVITASRSERASIAQLSPSARSRTFTLREAVRLASLTDIGDAHAESESGEPLVRFAEIVNARRGLMPAAAPVKRPFRRTMTDPFDVPDGHLIGGRSHVRTISEMREQSERFVESLRSIGSLPVA